MKTTKLTEQDQLDAKRLGITLTLEDNELNDALRHDAIMMADLLNAIDNLNIVHENFFRIVSSAFLLQVAKHPESTLDIFNTFITLQEIFRIVAKRDDFITEKITDYQRIDTICDKLEAQYIEARRQTA